MMNFVANLDRFLKSALIVLLVLMVAAVTWQVLSRYALGDPSHWTEELARYLLIWIGLLGSSWAYRSRMHLGLNILAAQLSAENSKRLSAFCDGMVILFALLVMVFGGGKLIQLAWQLQQTSAALGIYMAWVYIVIPVSGLLIAFYGVLSILGKGYPVVDMGGDSTTACSQASGEE